MLQSIALRSRALPIVFAPKTVAALLTKPTILTTYRRTPARATSVAHVSRCISTTMATGKDQAIDIKEVEKDGQTYRTVKEGKATILVPQGAKILEDKGQVQQVFYNPIQQFNRDLSVLAIKAYGEETIERRQAQHASRLNKNAGKQSRKRKREHNEEGVEATEAQETTAPAQEDAKPYYPSFKIFDALSASGLRALRYAHELPFLTSVVANDLSSTATKSIRENVEYNKLEGKIEVNNDDALAYMYRAIADDLSKKDRSGNPGFKSKFDVVDLDPYGTGAPFFDAAVQAVRDDGGLLCITCTDSAIWAGHSYCEKTYALYGGIPIKGLHSHEAGLRLVLNAIASSAARYGLMIEPQLSLSIDFYVKLFVKVVRSPASVKFLGAKTMLVYNCDAGCGSWTTQPLMRSKAAPNKKGDGAFYKHSMAQAPSVDMNCKHCGFKTHLSGPMWGGKLHNSDFIQRILTNVSEADPNIYGTLRRLEGMLQTALEEHLPGPDAAKGLNPQDVERAAIDHYPFYFIPGKMSHAIGCVVPPEDLVRGALAHLGYRTTRSHCKPGSIKTDAPFETLWWVWAEWIRQKAPIKADKITPLMASFKLLTDAGIIGREGDKTVLLEPKPSEEIDAKMEDIAEGTSAGNGLDCVNAPTEAELRKTLIFDEALASLGRQAQGKKMVRYQQNPERYWGPQTRARGN